ncbi:hypothetical protein HAX54_014669 [Datura stramonium]|uniref:Uncharacterized protein n=1 Tax=Datura stramonium TaxID=4076 RepID=A0ABS8TNF3_DATST|nr:hypothetical protein [Datura stramonium]
MTPEDVKQRLVGSGYFTGTELTMDFGYNYRTMVIMMHFDESIRFKTRDIILPLNMIYEDSVRLVIKDQDTELEKITTIMTVIDLSSNYFEGVIPKALMDLGSLWLLNLFHNNLKGDIPMELGS